MTKGIILAGGSGTRLHPLTAVTNKHLLPVFDKPMVYYPLTTLMLGGIKDILIISTPEDKPKFEHLLGTGEQWGITLSYAEQPSPDGLAQAFIIGEDFIGDDDVCLILGDNILYGHGLGLLLSKACSKINGGTVFAHYVNDPKRYGVITIDDDGMVTDIEEKPSNPKSNFVAIGLYCYDASVIEIAKNLKPSARGELEITDVNRIYLQQNKLKTEFMSRGFAWFDVGEPAALNIASQFVETVESRQNIRIACPEEVAFRMDYIDEEQLKILAEPISKSAYGQYILSLTRDTRRMGES
jgi:glucose-1-phosphate thymidylyltransferase